MHESHDDGLGVLASLLQEAVCSSSNDSLSTGAFANFMFAESIRIIVLYIY